jgi:predicted N-acetyltransferase YhbS
VLARDEHGAVIATARAVSDGVKYCYLGDVAVRSDWRRRGVGAALVRMLLDHPAVRRAARGRFPLGGPRVRPRHPAPGGGETQQVTRNGNGHELECDRDEDLEP